MRPDPIFRTDLKAYQKIKSEAQSKLERNSYMIKKLEDQIVRGFIENAFAIEFVESIRARHNAGLPLSEKQQSKLEELFEQY